MDQNDSTFQDESKDTSDSIFEYNLDSMSVTPFESLALYNEYLISSPNLERTTLLYTFKSLYSSEPLTLDNSKNLASPPDSFTYLDPPNINFSQNTKKHNHGQLLEPIATMSPTCWNSVFVLNSKDGKKLEALLLNKEELLGLKELISLLEPFAYATCLIDSDTYPTLSLMLPTIATLQEYLFKLEKILTNQVIYDVRDEIELNIADR
ncbi:24002_t:CDS:2 [Racocetra persica]|uniref:24002_t:CDS:1 n=1 Tax=Racocetra persica TaxID=160502 RepID=A0ACA9QJL7_9GLOM|nr:24002_t:CDS:2 [Racocetra persica]